MIDTLTTYDAKLIQKNLDCQYFHNILTNDEPTRITYHPYKFKMNNFCL